MITVEELTAKLFIYFISVVKIKMDITFDHHAGFFSCCSVSLYNIICFINKEKRLPSIDFSKTFKLYKKDDNDVSQDFFMSYENITLDTIPHNIKYHYDDQYIKYSELDFANISPLIKKYFSPSNNILRTIDWLINKYEIDTDNIIAVYYRGTDKKSETNLGSFEDFYNNIKKLCEEQGDKMKLLLQSDSAQFVNFIRSRPFLKERIILINENNVSFSEKGIHNQSSASENHAQMIYLLSTFIIISRCQYIICNSSNCTMWMLFYRGHCNNVIQFNKCNFYYIK